MDRRSYLLAASLLLASPVAAQRPQEGALKPGDALPPLVLTDLQGQNPVDVGALRGRPHVLIFGSCT